MENKTISNILGYILTSVDTSAKTVKTDIKKALETKDWDTINQCVKILDCDGLNNVIGDHCLDSLVNDTNSDNIDDQVDWVFNCILSHGMLSFVKTVVEDLETSITDDPNRALNLLLPIYSTIS